MKDFIKKNILNLVILILIIAIIFLIIFGSSGNEELSYSNMKEYSNELRSKGLHEQAIESYKQFLKNTSLPKKTKANIHYFIGEIYRDNLKDFDKALAHFIKIRYIHPNSPLMNNVNQKIVECLENSGRSREAQLALKESTALNKSSRTKETSVVLAKIDNDIITLADFNNWYDELPDNIRKEFAALNKKKELLQQYIGQELMYRMAMRKGFHNDPAILKKSFEVKKNLMAQKVLQEELLGQIKITPRDIELYYNAHKDKYNKPLNQVVQLVQQDFMQEKIQEKSRELLNRMVKANSVQIFDDNLR